MELKKSISDTERALRSYGAVSETAWTTDKGESNPRSVGKFSQSASQLLHRTWRAASGETVNVTH